MQFPAHLLKLQALLRRLPGVGQRTAERYSLQLLEWPEGVLQQLAETLSALPEKVKRCELCGSLTDRSVCDICTCDHRDRTTLCVVAHPRDVIAFEETRSYRGLYHVLPGLLSPMEQRGPESLGLERLATRLAAGVTEVILALDTTLEGDATALFLQRELSKHGRRVTRLAFGLPLGSALEYVDSGTLLRALIGRQ